MAFDLSLLSQLLPLAGAGAQGYMAGDQQALQAQQIKQVMALREAEEMRSRELHPLRIQAQQQNMQQSEQLFPEQLEGAMQGNIMQRLGIRGQEQQVDQTGGMLAQMMGQVQPGFQGEAAAPYGQQLDLLRLFAQRKAAEEATKRKGMLTGGEAMGQETKLLKLYQDTLRLGTPKDMFDYVMANEPEMAQALSGHAATGDRNAFAAALAAQIKARYGYDVGRPAQSNGGPSYLQGMAPPVINFR